MAWLASPESSLKFIRLTRLLFGVVISGAALPFYSFPSVAGDVQRTATSGEPKLMRRYFSWNADCSFKVINVDVTAKPARGTIEPRFGDYVLTKADVRGGSINTCEGKSIRVVELHYTPQRGYRGKDSFSVRVQAEGLPTITDKYVIDVK